MTTRQTDLFAEAPAGPEGLIYRPDLVSEAEETQLAARIATLELKPFEFRGYQGLRRVKAFGWRYDYGARAVQPAVAIPDFLQPLRRAHIR